jgi:excisionase family DNA binding protein
VAQPARDELTILDAAALVHRSAETIRRWVWAGRLKARRSGRHLLVSRRDVEALTGGGNSSLSLQEWGQLAEQVLRRPKRGGRSSADLVLADRRQRSHELDAST